METALDRQSEDPIVFSIFFNFLIFSQQFLLSSIISLNIQVLLLKRDFLSGRSTNRTYHFCSIKTSINSEQNCRQM